MLARSASASGRDVHAGKTGPASGTGGLPSLSVPVSIRSDQTRVFTSDEMRVGGLSKSRLRMTESCAQCACADVCNV